MPRNRQHIPLEERRTGLLDAATEVFATKGYVATTMDDIARSASVTRANLYWYYSSKDDIFAATMTRMLEKEIATLEAKKAAASAEQRLIFGLREMFPYRSLHREMHERLPYSEEVSVAHRAFMAWMRKLVDEVVTDSEVQVESHVIADVTLAIFEGSHTDESNTPAHVMIPVFFDAVLRPHSKPKGEGRRVRTPGVGARTPGTRRSSGPSKATA